MTYATLLHGEPDEVMEILDRGDADMAGLGMALCNAMRRIRWLEAAARTRPPPADALRARKNVPASHTPGPWFWDGNTLKPLNPDPERSAVYSILDADGGFGFLGSDRRATLAELDADRALIARAPDLLELLLEALDLVPRMSDDDPMAPALADWCGRVRAALSESG